MFKDFINGISKMSFLLFIFTVFAFSAPSEASATCTYTGTLNWGSCSKYYSGNVSSGSSVTLTNDVPGYTGTLKYSCSGTTWSEVSRSCTPNPCNYTGTVTWGSCSKYYNGGVSSGSNVVLTNSAPGFTGSITYSCSLGTWSEGSKSCTSTVAAPTTFTTWNLSPLTSTQGTTVNASWAANNSPTAYYIVLDGAETPMGTATTWTGIPAVGTFSVKIKACNTAGCTYSATKTLTVTNNTPTSPFVNLSKSSVSSSEVMTVSWGATGSVTKYYLNVDGSILDQGTATFWTGKTDDIGLAAGAHNISVQACNGALCSAYSTVKTLTVTLAAPTSPTMNLSKTAVNSNEDMTFSWSATGKVTNYFIKVDSIIYDMGTTTSWFGKTESLGILSGVHNFSVQACNLTACSAYSSTKTLTVTEVVSLDTIVLSKTAALTTDMLTVSWSLSGSPTRYEVKVDDVVFDLGGATTWTGTVGDIGIGTGAHNFSVRGCIDTVCGSYTPTKSLTVTEVLPTSATIVLNKSYALTVDTIDSSWSGNNYPTHYYAKVDGSTYDVGESTSWSGKVQDLGLTSGTHYFSVQACNVKGCSAYSPTKSLTVTPDTFSNPIPPTTVSVGIDTTAASLSTDFTATWVGNNVPTYYNIKLDSLLVGTTVFPSWTGTPKSLGITEGTHYVSAQACNTAGCSSYSTPQLLNVVRVKKPTSAPVAGNVDTPITTTAAAQTKTGSLYLFSDLDIGKDLSVTGNVMVDNKLTLAGKSNCNLKTDGTGKVGCASGGSSFTKSGPFVCKTVWGVTSDPLICDLPVPSSSMCFLTQISANENKDLNGANCHVYQDNGNWKMESWGNDYREIECFASCIQL